MGLDPHDVGLRLQTIVPGQNLVTLAVRAPAPSNDVFTLYAGISTRRRPINRKLSSMSPNALSVVERTFDLYRPSMIDAGLSEDFVPRAYDCIITPSSDTYTIQGDDAKNLESYIQVRARKNV